MNSQRMFHCLRNSLEMGVPNGVYAAEWRETLQQQCVTRLIEAWRERQRIAERFGHSRAGTRRELARRLGWAVDFMMSDLSRELRLSDVAAAARLSPCHFVRVFQQAHGRTPMDYLRQQRLDRALQLLESTGLPVNEVAARVGLSRLALWRGVRRMRGVAPSDLDQASTKRARNRKAAATVRPLTAEASPRSTP